MVKSNIKRIREVLKEIKPYEDIDEEIKTYVKTMVEDPFVVKTVLLNKDGFAGLNINDEIRYIWIFRNRRGNNFGAKYCLYNGVSCPTKEIMNNMVKLLEVPIEKKYLQVDNNILWHLKTGFEIIYGNIGMLPTITIAYNEYEYGKGTFNTLESIFPIDIHDLDLDKFEYLLYKAVENHRSGLSLPKINIETILK